METWRHLYLVLYGNVATIIGYARNEISIWHLTTSVANESVFLTTLCCEL